MKRILHIVGTMDRAGAETMVMNLYRAIDKSKYQFDFVYFTHKSCAYDDEIKELGGVIYRIPQHSAIIRTYRLYQLLKKNRQFYAVHCHQLLANASHQFAAFFAGMPIRISHAHSTQDIYNTNFIRNLYQKASKVLISWLSTDFIACGLEASNFLFPRQESILYIPNAIDVSKFINSEKKKTQNFFNINSIKNNTIIISQIGRFMPVKNHEFSIKFAFYLKQNNIDFHMMFAGSGHLENSLKQLVAKMGLSNNITFLGVREDIDLVLANSNLLLMPSLYEGFPVILVESQAAGTPALISNGISNEVDLGLGLVQFCDLKSPNEEWLGLMQNILKKERVSPFERNKVLKSKGFDIDVSVKLLEKLYSGNKS
ncbi:glycosyltransferase [Hwangdonia lutea]|uniref:Glycosyltransferase n=1 Tax=Hwangdonia lutea TaxID=3075823 RepID=A0AA97ELC9_9FLAO|nr:glycosyltransferase [Hwangdonia sp. SCSIO 19198]WOD43362.1 glycosyltransferase [Hwangdonia sp. SCSIO 19198]